MQKGDAHTAMMTIRMRPQEREMIETAARDAGTPVSDWVRKQLLARISERKMEESEGKGIEPLGVTAPA